MPTLVGVPDMPEKNTLPVIAPVPVSTTTAPRPVPDATGGELDEPPLPPPQETAIPTTIADTTKPIRTSRIFIMSISLRSNCYATGIAGYFLSLTCKQKLGGIIPGRK